MNYEIVEDLDDVAGPKLVIYVITHGTKDWGDSYVLRRQSPFPRRNMIYMEREPLAVAAKIEDVRAELPEGLIKYPLTAGDDPVIVETWL